MILNLCELALRAALFEVRLDTAIRNATLRAQNRSRSAYERSFSVYLQARAGVPITKRIAKEAYARAYAASTSVSHDYVTLRIDMDVFKKTMQAYILCKLSFQAALAAVKCDTAANFSCDGYSLGFLHRSNEYEQEANFYQAKHEELYTNYLQTSDECCVYIHTAEEAYERALSIASSMDRDCLTVLINRQLFDETMLAHLPLLNDGVLESVSALHL